MDNAAVAYIKTHMIHRIASGGWREKNEVARLKMLLLQCHSKLHLSTAVTRYLHTGCLGKDIHREAAAVDATGIVAAIFIWHTEPFAGLGYKPLSNFPVNGIAVITGAMIFVTFIAGYGHRLSAGTPLLTAVASHGLFLGAAGSKKQSCQNDSQSGYISVIKMRFQL